LVLIYSDDLISRLENMGAVSVIDAWADENIPSEVLTFLVAHETNMPGLNWDQVKLLLADLLLAGKITGINVYGDSLDGGITRPPAPTDLGAVKDGNVWCNAPGGGSYSLRFYNNLELKTTLTDYFLTDCTTLGAVSGDKIQICQVAAGIVGWMAEIEIPA